MKIPSGRWAWAPWIALPLVTGIAFALGAQCGARSAPAAPSPRNGDAAARNVEEGQMWTCSMHPDVRKKEPGSCPICGMDLVPVSGKRAEGHERHTGRITLSERARALARIRTTEVRRRSQAGVERRLQGTLEYDETSLQTVTAWTGGRIDRLHVEVTGTRVQRDERIATLYSPEVYAAHQDLLTALAHADRMKASTPARSAGRAAVESARKRLRLLGVPPDQLERMEQADAPWKHVPIRSPFGGTIVERIASEGEYLETGSPLYKLADLRSLWVQLDAYESDLALLQEGDEVELDIQAAPGRTFEGRVAFLDPVIDPQTRTAHVRVEVDNPDRKLRPGMFVEAIIRGGKDEQGEAPLVVPKTAPLFTGRRSVVYVEVPDAKRPTYQLRVVELGSLSGRFYPVLGGLRPGERVVTHGAFVLDADLQIRGEVSMMSLPEDVETGAVSSPPSETHSMRRDDHLTGKGGHAH